jgi:hypothetical protein
MVSTITEKSRRVTAKHQTPKHKLQKLQTLGRNHACHYSHGDVLTVRKMLRHKRIENTMKYIHMIQFKDEDYDVATATTVEEVKQFACAGFEKFDEMNGIHVFKRPKK